MYVLVLILSNSSFHNLINSRPIIQNCTDHGDTDHSVNLFTVHECTTYQQQTSQELEVQYGPGEGICCSVDHEGQGSH